MSIETLAMAAAGFALMDRTNGVSVCTYTGIGKESGEHETWWEVSVYLGERAGKVQGAAHSLAEAVSRCEEDARSALLKAARAYRCGADAEAEREMKMLEMAARLERP